MKFDDLKALNAARRSRRAAIYIAELGESGQGRVVVKDDNGETGEAGNTALDAVLDRGFRSGKSGMVQVDGRDYFLNVHVPPARIVVIGAVHISQALARLAAIADFDVTVIDPRTAFATPERFPDIRLLADWPDDVLIDDPLDAYTALVAVTHDPKIDDGPLKAALDAGCFYVGALGSRKTHAKRVERLVAAGASEAQIARIAAPIGVDIGASSPAEIAVAILAQIIQSLRKGPHA